MYLFLLCRFQNTIIIQKHLSFWVMYTSIKKCKIQKNTNVLCFLRLAIFFLSLHWNNIELFLTIWRELIPTLDHPVFRDNSIRCPLLLTKVMMIATTISSTLGYDLTKRYRGFNRSLRRTSIQLHTRLHNFSNSTTG